MGAMGAIMGFLSTLVGVAFGHLTKPPQPPVVPTMNPAVANWTSYVKVAINKLWKGAPFQFMMNWIEIESGGKACAIGVPGAVGPNGLPKEQGIGQFYNPDDFTSLKIPLGALRVYCVPGTDRCSRQLTSTEMQYQADCLVLLARRCANIVNQTLIQSGAKSPNWSENHSDYWCMVKMVHGIPGLVRAMPSLAARLGVATSWEQYKQQILGNKVDSGTERYRNEFPRVFLNAEKTASGIGLAVG